MVSKNPEVNARSKCKAAIKDLTFEQRVRVICDMLAGIGLASFAAMMREAFSETKREHYKDF